jgi:outer membrane protein
MNQRFLIAFVLQAAVTSAGAAQQPAAGGRTVLSVADAIAIARENSPTYRQVLNDRGPAAWGVRNAYAAFLPSFSASGGLGYSGPGSQRFLATEFRQQSSTVSSNYFLGLNWEMSGFTLSQPGLRKAQAAAVDADIDGATTQLATAITQQYLSVKQAIETAALARKTLERNNEFLRLAQARYSVGQATLIDVRQAQAARGQSEVAHLRAETAVQVEKLRLFQTMGVRAPVDLAQVDLPDSFAIQPVRWQLNELLTTAREENPALKSLRARESAAAWGARAARSQYLPTVSVRAGWSGFTQRFTDLNPTIASARAGAQSDSLQCDYANTSWFNGTGTPLNCGALRFTAADEQALRDQNARYPFDFTGQPFQASLTVSLPIFTQFGRPLAVSEANAQREDVAYAVRARELDLETLVNQAYLAVTTGFRAVGIQDTSRSAAQEQLTLATERYRVGSGTFFELLDAQVAYESAATEYVNAVYEYHKAVAALEAAVGRPLR